MKNLIAIVVLGLTVVAACGVSNGSFNDNTSVQSDLSADCLRCGQVSCTTDYDCMDAGLPTAPNGYLCVEGNCWQACTSSGKNNGCPKRLSQCDFVQTEAGGCYNRPGCNPPPDGSLCSPLCYGICR